MGRKPGTDANGGEFTGEHLDRIWDRADAVPGWDKKLYRRDIAGNIIYRDYYGSDTVMGWQIDHIKPVQKGGTDHPSNLQVLQTAANRAKGGTYPWKP